MKVTRKEAIQIIKHVFHFYDSHSEEVKWNDLNEACGMAISALNREQQVFDVTENCPSGFSKDKAIEWFNGLKEKFINTEYENYLDMAIKALEKQDDSTKKPFAN